MRDQRRAVDIANAVRLKRSQNSGAAILIVEGDDDSAFFSRRIDPKSCIIQVAHGKPRVLGSVAILDDAGFRGALGVIDADFDALEWRFFPSMNIVATDLHDIEAVMLSSPALHHLLTELGEAGKIDSFEDSLGSDVIDHVLRLGTLIGGIRWASDRAGWKLRFEGIDFTRFVSEKSFHADPLALVAEVRAHQGGSGGVAPPTAEEIAEAADALLVTSPDPWHLCCGHDLVAILAIGLRRVLGSHPEAEVRPYRLEQMLRLAFEDVYFRATQLFEAIVLWQTREAPFRVLPA